jgi:hypothetical protein
LHGFASGLFPDGVDGFVGAGGFGDVAYLSVSCFEHSLYALGGEAIHSPAVVEGDEYGGVILRSLLVFGVKKGSPFPVDHDGTEFIVSAGEQWLLAAGVSPALARFARTHGCLSDAHVLEDLLVMVADKIWKGKRDEAVEERLGAAISEATGAPAWDVFLRLDTLAVAIQKKLIFPGGSALEWQGQFGGVR